MGIDAFPSREGLHTNPANVSLTPCTGDMIATFVPLNGRFTSRAFLYVVVLRPFIEKGVSSITIRTIEAIVIFNMAFRADP